MCVLLSWSTVEPVTQEAGIAAPSNTNCNFAISNGAPDEVVQLIKDSLLELFNKPSYNGCAFESTIAEIIFDMAIPIIAYRGDPTEVSVREGLILPILRRIFERAPMLPEDNSSMFNIKTVPEDRVPLRQQRGRRPEVDFVVSINDASSGATIKPMLVEVKTEGIGKHLSQLAAYAAKVGTCNNFEGQVLLSILIDAEVYCLGFSVAMDTEKRSLPLLYVTRPILWRRRHDYPRPLNSHDLVV